MPGAQVPERFPRTVSYPLVSSSLRERWCNPDPERQIPHVLSHLSFLALSSAMSTQPPVTAETRIKKTMVVGSRQTRRTQGIEGGTSKRGGF